MATAKVEESDAHRVSWETIDIVKKLQKIREQVPYDCCILIGETRISAHRTAIELNSSLLTAGSVTFNSGSGDTEIEVEPEFDDQVDLVKDIVDGFYSGSIDIDDDCIKEVYKFGKFYEIEWLTGKMEPLFSEYMSKSYERFKEIFTFAHLIWDTDLFECCIKVLEPAILEELIKDKMMLSKISYNCMDIITKSDNIIFNEKDLFNFLVTWFEGREQKVSDCAKLFERIKFELIDVSFLINEVMDFMAKDQISGKFVQK